MGFRELTSGPFLRYGRTIPGVRYYALEHGRSRNRRLDLKPLSKSDLKAVLFTYNKSRLQIVARALMIGKGGQITPPPLPHHRTYGSVYGGSISYAIDPRLMKAIRTRQDKH